MEIENDHTSQKEEMMEQDQSENDLSSHSGISEETDQDCYIQPPTIKWLLYPDERDEEEKPVSSQTSVS